MIDRDPWDPPEPDAWMNSGDLWPEPPPAQPLLSEDEFEAITKAFYDRPWEDATRYQDGFSILLGVVGSIAVGGGSGEWASHEATQALRRVMARVLRGEMDAEVNRHG
jgi:hypothetical protein